MVIITAGIIFTEPDVDVDVDAVLILMQNYCQEPPHTRRMSSGTSKTSSILLRFLIVILKAGLIFTEPDVDVDVDADVEVMLS